MMTATPADARQDRIRILLMEDNPADVRLTQEVFKDSPMDCALGRARGFDVVVGGVETRPQYQTLSKPGDARHTEGLIRSPRVAQLAADRDRD